MSLYITTSHTPPLFHRLPPQVTLEEQMICGALQTLNEEAFEDVASNEMGPAPGETLSQQLAPIREGSEFSTSMDSGLSVVMPSFGTGGGNNQLQLGQARATNTNLMLGSGASVPEEEELVGFSQHQQSATDKDSTVIVMTPFVSQNMDDTSL